MKKIIKRKSFVFLISLLSLVVFTQLVFSNGVLVEKVGKGEINWKEGVIKMRGQGAPPLDTKNLAQARLMAERAAKAEAMRNFLEVVQGVRVDSETYVKDLVVQSDIIKTKVEGFVNTYATVKTGYLSDGTVYVDMLFPLYGSDGLNKVIVPITKEVVREKVVETKVVSDEGIINELKKRIETLEDLVRELGLKVKMLENKLAQKISPEIKVEEGPVVKEKQIKVEEGPWGKENYTGLIVDAQGLGLKPALSPKVLSEDGTEVYGTVEIDPDTAIERGVVGYAGSVEEAKKSKRVGSNPLIVKALKVKGNFSADAVISKSDAQKIRTSVGKDAFAQCSVVMVSN